MSHEDVICQVRDEIERGYYQCKKEGKKFTFTLSGMCKKIKIFPNKINQMCVADAIYALHQYDVFGYSAKNGRYTIEWWQDDLCV